MTPRERFRRITNHQQADRVPVDMGSHVASIHRLTYAKLKAYLNDPDMNNQVRYDVAKRIYYLARLYRHNGQYRMAIISGETVNISQEEYSAFVEARGSHQLPTAFLKMDVNLDKFIREFGSNHVLAVAGSYVDELDSVCDMLNITPVYFES